MKIIKPRAEFLGAVPTDYASALKFIEAAGRTCYKSEDKITDTSAEPFVKRLIKAGHLAMVEHSNFVVRSPGKFVDFSEVVNTAGKFLNVKSRGGCVHVGGSLTSWYQRFKTEDQNMLIWTPFLDAYSSLFEATRDNHYAGYQYWELCPHNEIPPELHRYSVRFICDRGVSHELVRHRPCSFAQESTRYVNYGGKDMEFIEPDGFSEWNIDNKRDFVESCQWAESRYKRMLRNGLKPQQARAVLPNALKTEIVVTADAAEWSHIKKLRTAKDAHPDMQRLTSMVPWDMFV